jgi:hypothetical protein
VSKSRNRGRSLQIESLESRELMAVTGSLKNGILKVSGTKKADTINLRQYNGWVSIAGVNKAWQAGQINSVVINLGKNNDVLSFNSLANGGNESFAENFNVVSSAGIDLVHLADGHDVTLNGTGHSLSVALNGTATLDGQVLSWNSGGGSGGDGGSGDNSGGGSTPANWFDSHVVDAALRSLGHNLYADGRIDRNDMISLLRDAEDGGIIDSTELTDLRGIASNTTLFGTFDYVWKLSSYIVSGNTANAKYQGGSLGNLAAGSSTAQMEKLINKWFLGLDRPTAGGAYRNVSGQLFVNGATYSDINQGYLGDCYLMASLGETALRNPSIIQNMFVVNGDGTYTVRFYQNGVAQYVTVDSYLPTDGAGRLIYAKPGAMYNNAGNELWTALAEKAYAQINEMGWLRVGLPGNGLNSYSAIEGGYIYAALGQISGQATIPFSSTVGATNFTTFVNAWNQGKSIGFASKNAPASSQVVGGHAYAVVGYNATNQTITLFNPWGTQYGLVTMTWTEIQANFGYFDRTA